LHAVTGGDERAFGNLRMIQWTKWKTGRDFAIPTSRKAILWAGVRGERPTPEKKTRGMEKEPDHEYSSKGGCERERNGETYCQGRKNLELEMVSRILSGARSAEIDQLVQRGL